MIAMTDSYTDTGHICRYLAAYGRGAADAEHQLTVFDTEPSQPEVLCQVRLHAAHLPPEPWQVANCMQLQVVR